LLEESRSPKIQEKSDKELFTLGLQEAREKTKGRT